MNWFEVILLQICKVFFKYIVYFLSSDMQGKEKLLHETVLDIIIGALLFFVLCLSFGVWDTKSKICYCHASRNFINFDTIVVLNSKRIICKVPF